MTYSTRTPTAPALPISALLAPQPSLTSPNDLLPSPSVAVLGPLPPTSALHLVLNYIALSDLPEYEYDRGYKQAGSDTQADKEGSGGGGHAETHAAGRKGKEPARALIITGNKDSLYHALQDEDEDWMREQGGGYGVMSRLKRCDIRYCSTPQQLTLLLALLTSEKPVSGDDAVYNFSTPPGLIILYDIASLFMHWEGGDENASANTEVEMDGLDGQKKKSGVEPHMVFNDHVTMSTYLDVIAAARTTAQHLSHGSSPIQLVILEPSISDTSTLPIMPKPTSRSLSSSSGQGGAIEHANEPHRPDLHADADRLALPSQSRSKRLTLIDGLSWMLGRGNIGVIRPDAGGDTGGEEGVELGDGTRYTLDFPDSAEGARYAISKRRCVGGEWASRLDGGDAEGAIGGWRWEWMAG